MNKKILLSSLVAAGVLIPTMLTTNVDAATIAGNGKKLTSSVSRSGTNYTLSVVVPSANTNYKGYTLTKSDVENLIKSKYTSDTVTNITKGSKKISKNTDAVGTGCEVTLKSGKKLTVVLYGDVNGDGKVSSQDALAIRKHNIGKSTINASNIKFKAAELVGSKADSKLKSQDALRIRYYNLNKLGNKTIVDSGIYPADTKVVNSDKVLQDAINEINSANKEKYTITLDTETNKGYFTFASAITDETDIKTFKDSNLAQKLVEYLNKNKDSIEKIELKFNSETQNLTANMDQDAIKNVAIKLLKGTEGKVNELYGKELTATFYIKNGSELLGIKNGTVTYTLKFEKFTDGVLSSAVDEINKADSDKFTIELNTSNNSGKITFKVDSNTSISTFANSSLVSTLIEKLKEYKDTVDSIELKLNNGEKTTATLKPESQTDSKSIIEVAKQLLGENITTIDQLKDKQLTATFKFKNGQSASQLSDETYTLTFETAK